MQELPLSPDGLYNARLLGIKGAIVQGGPVYEHKPEPTDFEMT